MKRDSQPLRFPQDGDAVDTEIDLGDRIVPLRARVNRRARRLIVKVDPVTATVLVTAPSRRALPEALRFAQSRKAWIAERLDEGEPARPFRDGGECPYRGETHLIINKGGARAPVRRCAGDPPLLVVGGAGEHLNRRLADWLKREARRALDERVTVHCEKLGKRYRRLLVRDTRSRWGSCSSDGVLSFSWRLILAPPPVLDYVAAHESAHLVHLNHSPAYWRLLKSLDVDIESARAWFDAYGAGLHAWGATAKG